MIGFPAITNRTSLSHIENTSFILEYEILNESGEVCARGTTVQVMVDPKSGKKITISNS
jgi:acyl-CoA thioesterase FadM